MAERFITLEEYGVVGDQETCALIGSNGSIDWLTLPYMDSSSAFAAILDPDRGGSFSITPVLKFRSIQKYVANTNVLVTDFTTATGEATITDFMPPLEAGGRHRILLRRIEGKRLSVTLRVRFRPRFDYGRVKARMAREGDCLTADGGETPLKVCGVPWLVGDGEAEAVISVQGGETVWLAMMWGEGQQPPEEEECERLLEKTVRFWMEWSHQHERSESVLHELFHDLAMRSGLVLKLLLDPASGGIAAAPTLALPEAIGGIRNWDYRFSWIRDASFTAQALHHLGYRNEAAGYRNWVLAVLRQLDDLSGLRPFYPIHESAKIDEGPAESLCGYLNSGPVRVGNRAGEQTQLDIYGEFVNTVFETTRYGDDMEQPVWDAVKRICAFVCDNWGMKDRGMWEMRTEPKNYVHSKLMCWVALDRALKMARREGLDAPLEQWSSCADDIRHAILEKGFSKGLNSFVQSFEEEEVDSTGLLIPIHQFLPPEDPRVQGTIDAIWKRLSAGNGLLYRYRTDDGLAGREGAFTLCSFWLVTALSVSRRIEEAESVLRQVLEQVSPLGLLSEEIDPCSGRLLGNFPQAISHIGLINAALHLGIAKGRGYHGPPPQSEGERY